MNGPLRIRARTRNGEVAKIEILSPRIDPSAVFVGRTPEDAVVLASRLFSLCPMAQSIAVRAATGLPPAENEALALLGERLAEMLRASLLDWPGAAPVPDEIAALRDVLALLRRLPAADASIDLGALQKVFARQRAEAEADEAAISSRPCVSDFLTPEDDAAVVAGLWADKAFSRAPALPGRRPETGVAARRGIVQGGMTARLAAREADMIETAAAIETILHGGPAPENLVARCGPYPKEPRSASAVEIRARTPASRLRTRRLRAHRRLSHRRAHRMEFSSRRPLRPAAARRAHWRADASQASRRAPRLRLRSLHQG